MLDFNDTMFSETHISPNAKIVFVSDFFIDEYVGGAELTSQALIDSSPFEVAKVKSKNVTINLLQNHADKFWIFGNFTQLNAQFIPSIVANLKYSILEYDYKFCKARSPEKHFEITKTICDCAEQINGKIISAFYYGAMHLWWMSEKQKSIYESKFPFLAEKNNTVLSSVFDDKTLAMIKTLRLSNVTSEKKGWIVLGSSSWVKGFDAAKQWCIDNKKEYEIVWDVPYEHLLAKLAVSEGFVYLPAGGDTCPRMVIEAKLLGCKLHINNNVQHSTEEWFSTDNLQETEEYLYSAKSTFWSATKLAMDYKPEISGYTTTRNCIEQQYPFIQCINSMLEFCAEVCVVDGGSTDGTVEILQNLAKNDPRIKVKIVERDWNHPRFSIFDGLQKAEARKMCNKEFCWQMDSDEIVHEDDVKKILDICRSIPKDIDIIALPVLEYWGSDEKVRLDIQPWKWRLSRNKSHITHGIPNELRKYDENGNLYSLPGSDGCDMIHKETHERLPFVSFYNAEVEKVRSAALMGNNEAKIEYQNWYNSVVNNLPTVFHYGWYNLERKIKLYKNYWTKHWENIFGNDYKDLPQQNMMFDVPWSEVTDEMIKNLSVQLNNIGGWIWHTKWNGYKTPWLISNRTQPKFIGNFYDQK